MRVSTVIGIEFAQCIAHTTGLGPLVISSERNEWQAQAKAARFLDTNFPGEDIQWDGGYHGGDTNAAYYSDYFGDRVL